MKEKRVKKIKPYVIGFVIGGILFGSIGVIADTIINSSNVAYKETTVKSALDDLYAKTKTCINPSDLSGSVFLQTKEGETTTREGCTGNGLFTKVTHENGDVDYRFQGACPNNYVNFNNETWRIIGIFDGRMKIIRDERIDSAGRKWDCPGGDSGSCSGYKNNWETSTLKTYLNGNYYDSISSEYQAMIDDRVTWYLGGWDDAAITKEAIYGYERSGASDTLYSGNPATSTSTKIGLVYPSDYGYATTDACTKNLNSYNNTTCKNNNWMFKSNYSWWTIAPYSSNSYSAWRVNSPGDVNNYSGVHTSCGVRPVLYLKSSVKLGGGDGSSASAAYTLSM